MTFETLSTILTIEDLNYDNLCDLTINCDTGQHSQFLRCFCPWGCSLLLLIPGQNLGRKYSDTNGMHAGSFFVHVMFPFHSGMVTKLRFPDFCSQEIFVINGGKIIFYNIVGKSGFFLVLTPFIHLSQFFF